METIEVYPRGAGIFRLVILCAVLAIMFAACATDPFSKYYTDRTGGFNLTTSARVILPTSDPKIFQGSNPDSDLVRLMEDGYSLVGYSSWNGGTIGNGGAIKRAKEIHASVIVIYSKYRGTLEGSIPLVLPNTQTSTTSMNGTVFGSGGNSSFFGTATTTTSGSSTINIPYSQQRFDYFVSYWIKLKSPILGTILRPLSPELRAKIQSNKGALVIGVVKGSPAFEADIVPGDILKSIGDVDIIEVADYRRALGKYAGQIAVITVFRGGGDVTKNIQLNANEGHSLE